GKSTSIRLLQAAIAPTGGAVSLLGAPVDSPAYASARRQCGIVPQQPGMYRDLTGAEYLHLACELTAGRQEPVVEEFGLGPHLEKRMAQLSGGLQRRLTLAAALVGEPALLLLDEPTAGLDPVAARDVHDYLRAVMAGRTTLLCTHNLAEAEALCDLVVILRDGQVIVQGGLDELRAGGRPRLRLAARQGPQAILDALGTGAAGTIDDDGRHLVLEVTSVDEDAPALLRRLLGAGVDVTACEPVEATLTDLFLEAVG
ncbi:MAG: ABC transporter ATP-binding protein, partial [Candidatus Dormiibacterota bacterium]